MNRVAQRLAAISESATMAISNRASVMRASGLDVISFGAGEPDFPTPDHIVEAAAAACRDPRNHKYTANAGLPELRGVIAAVTAEAGGPTVEVNQILVTNGGKQAVYQAFAALLDPGDEALVPAPYWVTYPDAIALAGGIPVPVPTDDSTGFRVTVEALEAACTERTKLLVFVSPSNPTGAVYTAEETRTIGQWAARRGIWVVTDEIYQHLVYGDSTFTSMPSVAPELGDRWVIVNGVAKSYAMTGWRVGWMIGPADVIKAAANHQSHCTSNVANVSQRAALAALTGPQEPVEQMRLAFDRRRRIAVEMLNAIPGVSCVEPHGAFYAFPNFTGLLDRDLGGITFQTGLELGAAILEKAQVAVVPGEAFGAPGYARISYALSDENLRKGLERIHEFVDSVSNT